MNHGILLTLCAKLCAIRTSESVLNVSLELVITTSLCKMIRHPSENLQHQHKPQSARLTT